MKQDAHKIIQANYHVGALQYIINVHIDDGQIKDRLIEHTDALASLMGPKEVVSAIHEESLPTDAWDSLNANVNDRRLDD